MATSATTSRLRVPIPARSWLVPAALVAGYLTLRLPIAFGLPTFFDEALYGSEASTAVADLKQLFISMPYAKPPGQLVLALGPIGLGMTPVAAVRLVSLLCGLVTMAGIAALGERLGGRRLAVASAAIYAIVPYAVVNDVVGTADPIVTAAGVWALFMALRLADGSKRAAAAFALLVGAAFAAKLSGLLLLVLPGLGLVFTRTGTAGDRRRSCLLGGTLALAVVGALYAVLALAAPSTSLFHTDGHLTATRALADVVRAPDTVVSQNWPGLWSGLRGYVSLPGQALAIIGAIALIHARRGVAAIVVTWAIVATLAALLIPLAPFPRYLMPAVPALVVLVAGGGLWVADAVRARNNIVAVALLAACALPALWTSARLTTHVSTGSYPGLDQLQYVTGESAGSGWTFVARTLERRVRRAKTVVVAYDNLAPLRLGLVLGNPNIEHDRRGISWREAFHVDAGGRRYEFVRITDPRARRARFLVRETGARVINRLPLRSYRQIAIYTRVEGLSTIQLLERA